MAFGPKPGSKRHGLSHTMAYRKWKAMRHRCESPKAERFRYYGGRGIKVCERWQNVENFVSDMGEPPPGMELERIDNDGDYCPENCRWASRKEQMSNTSANVFLTYLGKTLTVQQWSDYLQIPITRLWNRIRAGWPIEHILSKEKYINQNHTWQR